MVKDYTLEAARVKALQEAEHVSFERKSKELNEMRVKAQGIADKIIPAYKDVAEKVRPVAYVMIVPYLKGMDSNTVLTVSVTKKQTFPTPVYLPFQCGFNDLRSSVEVMFLYEYRCVSRSGPYVRDFIVGETDVSLQMKVEYGIRNTYTEDEIIKREFKLLYTEQYKWNMRQLPNGAVLHTSKNIGTLVNCLLADSENKVEVDFQVIPHGSYSTREVRSRAWFASSFEETKKERVRLMTGT